MRCHRVSPVCGHAHHHALLIKTVHRSDQHHGQRSVHAVPYVPRAMYDARLIEAVQHEQR